MSTTPNSPQPTTAPATAPAKKTATRFITPALALIAVLGIGIYGGVLIGQNTASASPTAGGFGGDRSEMTMPAGGGAMGGMGGLTSGTVISVDGTTMVIENSDGEQVTVTTTDDTSVTETTDTTLDALTEGDSVTIVGEADDSGDVAATSISEGATTGFPGQAPTE